MNFDLDEEHDEIAELATRILGDHLNPEVLKRTIANISDSHHQGIYEREPPLVIFLANN